MAGTGAAIQICNPVDCLNTDIATGLHDPQAMPGKQAVFFNKRHYIRHSGDGHHIEILLQVKLGQTAFLQHSMGQLEHHTGAAQVGEGAVFLQLGIHHSHSGRAALGAGLMVVQNHHINTLLLQPCHLLHRGSTTVHSNNQVWRLATLRNGIRHAFLAQAIPLAGPNGYKVIRADAVGPQNGIKKRDRAHAVHIIVAIDADVLAVVCRAEDALNGCIHLPQGKRVSKIR